MLLCQVGSKDGRNGVFKWMHQVEKVPRSSGESLADAWRVWTNQLRMLGVAFTLPDFESARENN